MHRYLSEALEDRLDLERPRVHHAVVSGQRHVRDAVTARDAHACVKEELFILFDVGASVARCYRITDVTLVSDDSVVDAGPFEVKAVFKRFGEAAVHHVSCELERVR